MKVVAEIPADAQPIGCMRQQLAFRTETFEEEDELEFEEQRPEGTRINRGPTASRIVVCNQFAHEGQVQGALKLAIDVINRDEVFQCYGLDGVEDAPLAAHHDALLPYDGRSVSYRRFFNTLGPASCKSRARLSIVHSMLPRLGVRSAYPLLRRLPPCSALPNAASSTMQ